jgi:hypothetical protein
MPRRIASSKKNKSDLDQGSAPKLAMATVPCACSSLYATGKEASMAEAAKDAAVRAFNLSDEQRKRLVVREEE